MSKKNKKTGPRQVKRPANKKPRPKKFVEAKIPKQTKQQEPVEIKPPDEGVKANDEPAVPNTVSIELPENTSVEQLTHYVNLAADKLKKIAEKKTSDEIYYNQMAYVFGVDPIKEKEREIQHNEARAKIKFKTGKKSSEINRPKTEPITNVVAPRKQSWLDRVVFWFKNK